MPDKKTAALRRRIAPATPLRLDLQEYDGSILHIDLNLAFDMNAGAAVQEKTRNAVRPNGLLLTERKLWLHIGEPEVIGAMLWAATLAHHPEYDVDEGLIVVRSYIQESNADQITDALWKAYLAYLPKEKRELYERLKAEAEEAALRGDETNGPLDETKSPANETKLSPGSSSGPLPGTTSVSSSASSAS
jgi:hypothetical protein